MLNLLIITLTLLTSHLFFSEVKLSYVFCSIFLICLFNRCPKVQLKINTKEIFKQ